MPWFASQSRDIWKECRLLVKHAGGYEDKITLIVLASNRTTEDWIIEGF